MARRTAAATKPADNVTLLKEAEPAALPAVQQQGGALTTATADPIFAIIERLSKDPAFDVEKMERLIKMHQSAKADNARAEFDQAMSLAQKKMMAVRTNAKSDKGKYANYAALDKAIRPIYTEHGFSVSFDTDPGAPELTVRLVATVAHSSGHRERRQLDVPADGKGAKGGDVMTKTHATASAITYGKRYLSSMIWNLAVNNDDDGNAAGDRAKAWTDTAIQELNALEKDKTAFAAWLTPEKEKSVTWLKKNAAEEFARYQIAYKNAAERAGIKDEEPKRGDKKKDSPAGGSPHNDQAGDGQPGAKAVKKAATPGQPAPDPKPVVTDVKDENAIEFPPYKTAGGFYSFSDTFLQSKATTPAMARLWEAFYRDDIARIANNPKEAVRAEIADTLGLYHAKLKEETPA